MRHNLDIERSRIFNSYEPETSGMTESGDGVNTFEAAMRALGLSLDHCISRSSKNNSYEIASNNTLSSLSRNRR
jgi:hypothetical protein